MVEQRRLLSSLQYIPFLRDIGAHFFDQSECSPMDSVNCGSSASSRSRF